MSHKRMVLAGALAQRPGHGGHTWVFLQYLLGFRRLGWDVLFLDRLEPEMCVDAAGQPCAIEDSWNQRYLLEVMQRFGLSNSFSLRYDRGSQTIGLTRREVLDRARHAGFLLNVMGFLGDDEVMRTVPRRVFLDIDPGFGQMWCALGLADVFQGHDAFVTIGENIGRPDCLVPTCGRSWITTPQPVVLEHWDAQEPSGEDFTSVASWRGPFGPIPYGGKTFGLRVHEFRKFVELPRLSSARFRMALDIHPSDIKDQTLLVEHGWNLEDPGCVAGIPWRYRDYIRRSRAEFMVAKNMYVQARVGWVSDRSICYLASGKPVLAQDTHLKHLYPVGEGLLTFSTLEEAVAGIDEITTNYPRHAKAAREIAVEYFDSDKVLGRLLTKLGVA